MTNWTKGPWVASQPWAGFADIRTAEGKLVFAVANPDPVYGDPEMPSEEKEANLHLIAAAPEMYEALEAMIKGRVSENLHNAVHPSGRFCHVCGCNSKETVHSHGCPVKMAEAALRKARGEQA